MAGDHQIHVLRAITPDESDSPGHNIIGMEKVISAAHYSFFFFTKFTFSGQTAGLVVLRIMSNLH